MSFWYLAHDNELLIDLDDATRATRTGAPWIETFFRRRLRDAIADRKLNVRQVFLARSTSPKHYHVAIRLWHAMDVIERLAWQLHLGSDLYRGRADLMRAARKIEAPSLLIRSEQIPKFYRPADRLCDCTTKHVTAEQPTCDVWRELRGLSPWELFGRSSPEIPERGVALPIGEVPIGLIMAKRQLNSKGERDGEARKQTAIGGSGVRATADAGSDTRGI